MYKTIFSTYRTGENRVTASIVAVLRCLAVSRIERILTALTGGDTEIVRFMNFANQLKKAKEKSVPDAEISSSFRMLIETKITRGALDGEDARIQLERHLGHLKATHTQEFLLVLTPDEKEPAVIDLIRKDRNKDREADPLFWNSFSNLNKAINELLQDGDGEYEVISEREVFLLRELQKMLWAEGLIGSSKNVLVVPARHAWNMYERLHAYIYKAGTRFRPVQYVAFYARKQIYPKVPRIKAEYDEVVFEPGRCPKELETLVAAAMKLGEEPGFPYKFTTHSVIVLSAPDDRETVSLEQPIQNEDEVAFAMGKHYVELKSLLAAKTTADLNSE